MSTATQSLATPHVGLIDRLRVRASQSTGRLVVLMASILSVSSFAFYYSQGLTLIYGDAVSHLNIARRVVDNISPGLAHLGTIWLPLPHLLMLPLVWIDPLWNSGLAGIWVSMVAYVVAASAIYGAVAEITEDKAAGLVGAFAFMASPSMLYMQTTPMTESLMIGTSTMALYFLVKWGKSLETRYLHMVGAAIFLAVQSRYDGWFYVPAVALCILLVAMLARGNAFAEASGLAFLSFGAYSIFLWMFYNWLITGNPLNFALGTGSASWFAQQQAAGGVGILKGDLVLTAITYGWAMVDVIGWVALAALLSGLLAYLYRHGFRGKYLAGYIFLTPIAFNIVSLFIGQSVLTVGQMPPYGLYNVRYGLMALPAAAFFAGCLASGSQWKKVLLVIVILFQATLFWPIRSMPVVAEPLQNMVTTEKAQDVAAVLRSRYEGGKMLISTDNDNLIFFLDLPFKNIIYEGNHPYWDISLEHPETYATWIVVRDTQAGGDTLYRAIRANPELASDFDLVYENAPYRLYRNRHKAKPIP